MSSTTTTIPMKTNPMVGTKPIHICDINKNPNNPIYARILEQKLFIKRSKLYQRRKKSNHKSAI